MVVCDAALDTLDTDALGEMLGDETDEESVLLSFSVRSMLSDRFLVPSDAAFLIGDALLNEIPKGCRFEIFTNTDAFRHIICTTRSR